MTIRTAIVIGGGVSGAAAAMALHKAGFAATVYEAHPDSADGIGAMLTVATNGIDALRTLDADRTVLAEGFPTPGIRLRSHTGKYLGQSRTGGTLPDGTLSHTIKRADLYRALHREAGSRGIAIEYGKRIVNAEDTGDAVCAVFDDGTEVVGDVLIGCDGVHSTVRRLIDPQAPSPDYAGLITTGGYARGVTVDAAPGAYEMIFGRRAFFGYAVAPTGEVWWFVNVPHRAEPDRGELAAIGLEVWRTRLCQHYAGDAGPAVKLIEATPQFAPMTAVHTIARLPRWHRGRMIVVGDAAHAPSPTSGQGASLSIEDAVELARCLRDLPGARAAFTAFEARRRARVEPIIKAAARINNAKAPGAVGRRLRDAMLPAILRMTANSKNLARTFDHHIEWDTPVTPSGEVMR